MEKEIIKESVGEALQHAGEPTTITTEVIELDRDRVTSQTDVPPEVFEFNLNGVPCFPRCDVSVLTGQQKTGKTFITSMLMACCINRQVLGFERVDEAPLKVMWIDTEQSLATTKRILKDRVGKMIGDTEFPDDHFFVFNMRRRTPKERREQLELAIETYKPDICIIDGIADMVDDINSGTDSTDIMQLLLSMAQEHKCNITANIHLNRTGDKLNLRGWLGTLMLQKSYEVFNCERLADNKTFAVEMLFSRLCQPCEDMYYRINEQGLPYTTKKPDTLQHNSKSCKDSRSSNTFNQEFVDQNPVNPELPWLFRKLFEAGFGSASFLGCEEMERRIMELSFIKQKQYYYRVVAEAEKQGVIKKVMTKNGRVGAILCPAD